MGIDILLSPLKELLFKYRERRRHAEYLAVQIVCVLDRYLNECCKVVADDGLCYGQRDESGRLVPQVPLPNFHPRSVELDWTAIPKKLMYSILILPNLIEEANALIGSRFEFADPPDYDEWFEERQYQYALLGANVYNVSLELRQKYGLPEREFIDVNPLEYLQNEISNIEMIRRKREEKQTVYLKSLGVNVE